ncbi:hypothetical protein RclHR1_00160021 [Rhizophagus clarus]|uniref:Uncharacterized protein n=1 Tax=Rhizophagus clarus TaxID=94130 RepID=A0A2Z6QI60_9GLOM|nr:hypothetical protein RclHR1_00160021 [Rhizophagus clarus]
MESLDYFEINQENLAIDNYNIRWIKNLMKGQYRSLTKTLNAAQYKVEFININSLKDIMDDNIHLLIHWDLTLTFEIINDRISYGKKHTSKENDVNISFRYKNFIKQLPTYNLCFERKVYGIKERLGPRSNLEDETWEHVWDCTKNEISKITIRNEATDEIINELTSLSSEQSIELKKYDY